MRLHSPNTRDSIGVAVLKRASQRMVRSIMAVLQPVADAVRGASNCAIGQAPCADTNACRRHTAQGKILAMIVKSRIETSGLRGTFAIAGHRAKQMPCGAAPDPVAALVNQIKWITRSDADPYVLMGVLAEGAIQALVQRIPVECQQDAAEAMTQFIAVRLRSRLAT